MNKKIRRGTSPLICCSRFDKAPQMFRRLTPFYLLAAGLLTALSVPAQSPASPTPDQGSQDVADNPQVSSHIAAAIRATLPKYAVAVAKKSEPVPDTGDLVILQNFVIFGTKLHAFTDLELASKYGLSEILRKRYSGTIIKGQDPRLARFTTNYAAFMLFDDERLAHIAEFQTMADELRVAGDVKLSKDLEKEISRAFMRRADWEAESIDRSANRNRR